MITENLSTLTIHKLTQEQYDRELEAGRIDPSALYLTPDDDNDSTTSVDQESIVKQIVEKIGTNQIPISTDIDGSIYNVVGYADAKRINSSGDIVDHNELNATNPALLTGFIPIKKGNIIYLKNCFVDTNNTGDATVYGTNTRGLSWNFYDSNKNRIDYVNWYLFASTPNSLSCIPDSFGYVREVTVNVADVAYIRMSLAPTENPANAVVTVNFESGKTLTEHLAEETMVLTSLQYGDTLPNTGVRGQIFFKKVT